MSQRLRTEAADLQVVFEERHGFADIQGLGREELPLVIEARPQVSTQPTFNPSPLTCKNMSAGVTPCVGLV